MDTTNTKWFDDEVRAQRQSIRARLHRLHLDGVDIKIRRSRITGKFNVKVGDNFYSHRDLWNALAHVL